MYLGIRVPRRRILGKSDAGQLPESGFGQACDGQIDQLGISDAWASGSRGIESRRRPNGRPATWTLLSA
jgi:hypothetical protein